MHGQKQGQTRIGGRSSDPSPSAEVRRIGLTKRLMAARREVGVAKRAGDSAGMTVARAAVDVAKIALGERGPVWWTDGTPDFNRRMAKNTPYFQWFDALT